MRETNNSAEDFNREYEQIVAEIASGKRSFISPEVSSLDPQERVILAELNNQIIPLFTAGRLATEIQTGFTSSIREPFMAEMGIKKLLDTLSKFFVSSENK